MTTIETDYYPVARERNDDILRRSGSHLSLLSMLARLGAQIDKRRSRRALLAMSDDQLKDLALSRSDAYREAHRRFWD